MNNPLSGTSSRPHIYRLLEQMDKGIVSQVIGYKEEKEKHEDLSKRIYSGNDKIKLNVAKLASFFVIFKKYHKFDYVYCTRKTSEDELQKNEKLLKEFNEYFFDTLIPKMVSAKNHTYEDDLSYAVYAYVHLLRQFCLLTEQKKPEKEIKEFFDTAAEIFSFFYYYLVFKLYNIFWF